MIPRRRWPIGRRDVDEWLRASRSVDRNCQEQVVADFERACREYLGCAYVRATATGRDSLELAMRSVGLTGGDEIIIPGYTLGELLPLLQADGYRLVPADVEPDTWNMSVRSVAERIGPETKAILALHLHGAPCDIEGLCDLAARRNLVVIEDCAHAMGASVGGRRVGTFGDAAFFSLEVNKALPTYGGGLVVLRDPGRGARIVDDALAGRPYVRWPTLKKALTYWVEEGVTRSPIYGPLVRVLMSPALASIFERCYRGSHEKLRQQKPAYGAFQARLGLAGLSELDERNARLNRLWEAMAASLPAGLVAQRRDKVGTPAFYNFAALCERGETVALRQGLFRRGVDVGIGSEVMDDCAAKLDRDDCPGVAEVFRKAVTLPVYDGLTRRQFDRVVRMLGEVVG